MIWDDVRVGDAIFWLNSGVWSVVVRIVPRDMNPAYRSADMSFLTDKCQIATHTVMLDHEFSGYVEHYRRRR